MVNFAANIDHEISHAKLTVPTPPPPIMAIIWQALYGVLSVTQVKSTLLITYWPPFLYPLQHSYHQ